MEQIGTVEVLRDRVYPLDAYAPGHTDVLVPPGVYPLYRVTLGFG